MVVTGHGGMVVPIGDAYAVAEAIVDLLRKPMQCRAMGAFNRERVLKENQPSEVGDRFEALYREVLQTGLTKGIRLRTATAGRDEGNEA